MLVGGGQKIYRHKFLIFNYCINHEIGPGYVCLNNDNKNWTILNDIRIQEVNLESLFALVYQAVWKTAAEFFPL